MPDVMHKIMRTIILIYVSFLLNSCNNKTIQEVRFNDFKFPLDSSEQYFPSKNVNDNREISEFEKDWYSEVLYSFKEPILYNFKSDVEVYRFTWLRSFHNPVVIRIQKYNDIISLVLKISNGKGGYAPSVVITDTIKKLTLIDWNNLLLKLNELDFWNLALPDTKMNGSDGSKWILEGAKNGNYHFHVKWTPGGSKFGECCKYFIDLANLYIPEDQRY